MPHCSSIYAKICFYSPFACLHSMCLFHFKVLVFIIMQVTYTWRICRDWKPFVFELLSQFLVISKVLYPSGKRNCLNKSLLSQTKICLIISLKLSNFREHLTFCFKIPGKKCQGDFHLKEENCLNQQQNTTYRVWNHVKKHAWNMSSNMGESKVEGTL